MSWLLAIVISFLVGAVSATFGVGGGFILVPVLSALLGLPVNIVVGSAVCYVLGPATTALLYRDVQFPNWRLPLIISGGVFVGVYFGGATLNLFTHSTHLPIDADTLVLTIYLLLLSVLGFFSIWESERAAQYRPVKRGWLNTLKVPPIIPVPEWNERTISLPMFAWFGMGVGYLSGLLGISGGLLIVPGLLYLFDVPAQATIVSSMIVVWIVSFQSTIVHAWSGNVDLPLVIAMLTGGTIGARVGASIGRRLRSQQLRRNFGILALSTAIFVAIRLVVRALP